MCVNIGVANRQFKESTYVQINGVYSVWISTVANELQYVISFELIAIQVLREQSNEQYYVNVSTK